MNMTFHIKAILSCNAEPPLNPKLFTLEYFSVDGAEPEFQTSLGPMLTL